MTTIRLVGGPTAVIEWAALRLITDPTFSPPGVHESAPGRPLTKLEGPAIPTEGVGPLDAALLSHDQHADNLDPAGRDLLARLPLTLTTPEAAARLGGTARPLRTWEDFRFPSLGGATLTATAVPARHGPPGCESLTGPVTGFVLHGPGVPTVYISGDNASLAAVRDVASRFAVDIALLFAGAARTSLFNGAPLTLTSADAVQAAELLHGAHVVPLHVRGWAHFSEGPAVISRAFAEASLGHRLANLDPGGEFRHPR